MRDIGAIGAVGVIRALVADDEEPARRKLRGLLAREEGFAIAAEAADGIEAVAALREQRPDVVFLDIQMPRLDGFGVIAEIGVEAMPAVVFVTAFDEHALRAFEVQALDYLLKPFSPSRFHRLADRLRHTLATTTTPAALSTAPDLAGRIERLLATVRPAPEYPRQLLVERDTGRQHLLAVDDVQLLRADGNYVVLIAAHGTYRRRATLADLEARLDPARFLRLNRSEVVRLDAVREIQPWFHGDARVVLHDGTVLTWSRRYRARAEGKF